MTFSISKSKKLWKKLTALGVGIGIVAAMQLTLGGLIGPAHAQVTIGFSSSGLQGEISNNPTSLQFGPDGRLYVAQQDATLYAYTVQRNGPSDYQVVATEQIDLIKSATPNHNDDGAPNATQQRQSTGLLVTGTGINPVVYVTSSDWRIAVGNDSGLDTNSGVITRLTCTGGVTNDQCQGWEKVDIVRGLPRSEENHSTNGMDLDESTNTLFVMQGGNANKGAPGNNFSGTPEYFFSAAMLSVDLDLIDGMPVNTDPRNNAKFVYDLRTLNDPTRSDIVNTHSDFPYEVGHPLYNSAIDLGDPFGGNNGLNQAIPEPGGPVQIYSPGYRNAYDVVFTEVGRLYTSDNGPNTNWGGLPFIYDRLGIQKGIEGSGGVVYNAADGDYCTNELNEDGSNGHGDNLHFVNGSGHYGGHPAPIRAFPKKSGVYVYEEQGSSWTQITGSPFDFEALLPTDLTISDFQDNPIECAYTATVGTIDAINASTNGIAEYTADNFSGALQGNILTAAFNGNIYRYELNADGDQYLDKETVFNGFGSQPLDVIAQGTNDVFGGTVWAATYGADNITVFEPDDYDGSDPGTCVGTDDPNLDEDNDNFDNADEIDNNTNPCSGGSTPDDNDGDFTSDLNDNDDDDDGILDPADSFAIDPNNGTTTNLPITYPFWNNDPGTGFFGLGFTGLMNNGSTDYLDQFDENALAAGGAAGKMSVESVTLGDAYQGTNTQDNAFQFGVNVDSSSPPFIVHTRVESPYFEVNGSPGTPTDFQSFGLQIGAGDQDNYLKFVVNANGGDGGVQVLLEDGGSASGPTYGTGVVGDILGSSQVDLYLRVDPATGTAQPKLSLDGGASKIDVGPPVALPATALDPNDAKGLAVGIISTAFGSNTPFGAVWDFLDVIPETASDLSAEPSALNFGDVTVDNSTTEILTIRNIGDPLADDLTITSVSIDGTDSGDFSDNFSGPVTLSPGEPLDIEVSFAPTTAGARSATLTANYDSGQSLSVALNGNAVDAPTVVACVNANGPQYTAVDGTTFTADQYFSGGSTFAKNGLPIASTADDALYQTERYGDFSYSIPVPGNGNYVVDLHFAEIYFGSAVAPSGTGANGARVFSVDVEGGAWTLGNGSTEYDIYKDVGADTAVVKQSVPVAVNDGFVDISFATTTNNAKVSAICVLSASGGPTNAPPTLDPIPNQVNVEEDIVDLTATAQDDDPGDNLSFGISDQPAGVSIEPTNGLIVGTIADGAASGSPYSVTVSVTDGVNPPVEQQFQWTVTASSGGGETVLYRINVGGPQVAAADASLPDWDEDTAANPSSSRAGGSDNIYLASAGGAHPGPIVTTDSSIPPSAPVAIFEAERWDDAAAPEMTWIFPVATGTTVEVRLFFAELFGGVDVAGGRVFDVAAEGNVPVDFDDIDPIAAAGPKGAFMRSTTVTVTDGALDLEFLHNVENPALKGIEIIALSEPTNSIPTIVQIDDVTVEQGQTASVDISANDDDPGDTLTLSIAVTKDSDGSLVPAGDYVFTDSGNGTASFNWDTDAGDVGIYTATVAADDGADTTSASFAITVSDVPLACTPGDILYRVNNGGPQLADALFVWGEDQAGPGGSPGGSASSGTPSPYVNLADADKTYGPTSFSITNNTGAPDNLFAHERYSDAANPNNMQWEFPLENGNYTVNLYFAENWSGAANPGVRVFDVLVEGVTELDDYDVYVAANGINIAAKETVDTSVSDGNLDIDFIKGAQNPAIKGIEIVCGDPVVGNPQVTITSPLEGAEFATGDVTVEWATIGAGGGDHGHLYIDHDVYADRISPVPLTGSYPISGLAPGSHFVSLKIADTSHAEYAGAVDTVNFTVAEPTGNPEALIEVTPGGNVGASTFSGDSFQITNTGDQNIVSVSIDLSTAFLPDVVFDPVGTAGDATAKCLVPNGITGSPGYVSPSDPCVDPFSSPHNGIDNDEGFDVITANFTDFNMGEQFNFSVDVDPTSIKNDLTAGDAGSISGFELIGATVTVEFEDGTTLSASLYDEGSQGNPGGSTAVVAPGAPVAPTLSYNGDTIPSVVAVADPTITIDGPDGADVTLLQVDARLYIDAGAPGGGFDVDPFEANEAMAKMVYSGQIVGGTADITVALLKSTSSDAGPDTGLNHFIAVVEGSGDQNSMTSNTIVLEYDESFVDPGEPEVCINAGGPAYTSWDGTLFEADMHFSTPSSTYSDPNLAINSTWDAPLYQTERYETHSYNIPVTASGDYLVELFFAEIYQGVQTGDGVGARVFNADIEGVPVLTDYDIIAEAGAPATAIVETFLTTVNDSSVDIDFITVVDNAKISAICVTPAASSGNTSPTLATIPDQANVEGETITGLVATASDGDNDTLTFEMSGQPNGVSIDPSTGVISGEIAADAAVNSPYSVTVSVSDGVNPAVEEMFVWTVYSYTGSERTVLNRINVGGPQVAAADATLPDWSEDSAASPSGFRTAGSNGIVSAVGAIDLSDPSVAGGPAPEALFQVERWDNTDLPEMKWELPVSVGTTVEVRLYFAETFAQIAAPMQRVFDVSVEGSVPTAFNDIDPFAIAGADGAFMRSSIVAVNDGTLDLEFIHGIENPALKGIEIVVLSQPPVELQPSALVQVNPGGGLAASSYNDNSFQIQNTGEVGIVKVTIDLSTAALPDVVFDPVGTAGDATAKCLEPNIVVGTPGYVVPTNECVDPFSLPHNGIDNDEGFDAITAEFTDFNIGEQFNFSVDIDPTSIKDDNNAGDAGAVSGFELIGSTVTVEFADGSVLAGNLFDDGSLGGSIALIAPSAPEPAPGLSVVGVTDPSIVSVAAQTIRVNGTPGDSVTLLQVDARLYVDAGGGGFEVDLFEANAAMAKELYTDTIGASGTVEIPVTLLQTVSTDAGPAGGINHFIAVVEGLGAQNSATSNVVILDYDPDFVDPGTLTPVSYWPLDETGGAFAPDAIGSNGFALLNGPTWQPGGGQVAGALLFDGSGDLGSIADSQLSGAIPASSANPAQSFTITAWINPDSLNNRKPILSKQGTTVGGNARGFLFTTGEGGTAGKLYFEMFSSDSNKTSVTSTPSLATGQWQHVAATYEFVGNGGSKIRLYIDGVEVGATDSAVGPVQGNPQPLDLGAYRYSGSYDRYFDGLMDDVRVYDKALTGEQIEAIVDGTGPSNLPPTANASATNPTSGEAPLTVNFDASASSDLDGTIVSYAWNFGDGSTGSGETTSHTYAADGAYTAALTVTDDNGGTDSTSVDITVDVRVNDPPSAGIVATPVGGPAPLTVNFDASTSSDDTGIATYEWAFGDSSPGSGETTSHVYVANGTYMATLIVTDDDGATDTASVEITVSASIVPPTASFTTIPAPAEGEAPFSVDFDASGSSDDSNIVLYDWDFGDGNTASGQTATASNMYTGAGSYTVTLTVTDNDGATDSTSATVTVTPSTGPTPAAYWPLDESSGTVAPDVAGGNDFALLNGAVWQPSGGQVVGALLFDGSGDLGSIADSQLSGAIPASSANPAQSFTITAWINPDSLNNRKPILSKQGTTEGGNARGFLLTTGEGSSAGNLYFELFKNESSSSGKTAVVSNTDLVEAQWQHVAVTYQFEGDGNSKVRLYINGVEDGATDTAVGPVQGNGQPLDLGAYIYSNSYKRFFDGSLDEVRIYDEALTPEQILFIFDGTEPSNVPPMADCDVSPVEGVVSLPVTYNGILSDDSDGSVTTYEWNFGDGNTSSAMSGTHTFATAGVFTVELTVSDNEGATGSCQETVTVSAAAQPPVITDDPDDQTVNDGDSVTFTVVATGTPPLGYQWQRDDGAGWTDIGGATEPSYTLPVAQLSDDGAQFRCLVSNTVAADVASNPATLTVNEVTYEYFEDFGSDAGDDPSGWVDTDAGNSMQENDSLFKTFEVDGEIVFGTDSTLSNIHSHTLQTFDSAGGIRYSGRMRMSASGSGIGVTINSDYTNSDKYYRLRRYGSSGSNAAFHLSPHGAAVESGTTNTGVTPQAGTWYRFVIEVEATGTETQIRAKVWEDGTNEPAGWQMEATDSSAPLASGAIGVWGHSSGNKYWDDLKVEKLVP